MISSWMIYGMIVLGNLGIIGVIFGIISLTALFFAVIYYVIEISDFPDKDNVKAAKLLINRLIIASVVLWLLAALCPSTKEMAAIYLIPKIANNEQVQQIPNKALTVLNKYLDEWIKDQVVDKKEK